MKGYNSKPINWEERGECWECISHYSKPRTNGVNAIYPAIYKEKKKQLISRLIWELDHGPIPRGMLVLHRCDNPSCIKPSHLFLGTDKDNTQDCLRKGRFTPLRGEANGHHKLSSSDVEKIRKSKLSCEKLGKVFGVCASAIHAVRLGVNWRYQ
jgi:hypothetical protein